MNIGSWVGFLGEGGDGEEAFALEVVAEAMPDNQWKGCGFGGFRLVEGDGT